MMHEMPLWQNHTSFHVPSPAVNLFMCYGHFCPSALCEMEQVYETIEVTSELQKERINYKDGGSTREFNDKKGNCLSTKGNFRELNHR